MADVNMSIALQLARGFASRELELPAELTDVDVRAQFLNAIDGPLLFDGQGAMLFDQLAARVRGMASCSESLITSVSDPLDRVAIALRLWGGSLMAAKTIALGTLSGPNTSEGRAELFQQIDAIAAADPIFCAGVETAPAFKRLRNEPYVLDGVPEQSPVRRFA